MFAVEGDGRFTGSEGVGDEAGEDMDHGIHDGPVAWMLEPISNLRVSRTVSMTKRLRSMILLAMGMR